MCAKKKRSKPNQESDDQEDDNKNHIQSEDSLENQRTQYNGLRIRHICHEEEAVLTFIGRWWIKILRIALRQFLEQINWS